MECTIKNITINGLSNCTMALYSMQGGLGAEVVVMCANNGALHSRTFTVFVYGAKGV